MSTPTEREPLTPDERASKKSDKKQRQKANKKKLNHAEYRDGAVTNKKPRAAAPWTTGTVSPQFSDVVVTQRADPEPGK